MKRDGDRFIVFFIFLFLSFFLLFLSPKLNLPRSLLEKLFSPFQSFTYNSFNFVEKVFASKESNDQQILYAREATDLSKLKKDISALKDQFQTTNINSQSLLPANIIGAPGFIPNVTVPEIFILDKGEKDGIKAGMAVLYKDNLVGKITRVSPNLSAINLLTSPSSSFTAKIINPQNQSGDALGVIKGRGNGEMVLDNVLLSEKINKSDIVVTKGDINEGNIGLPPDLIVGKIISIDKKPSNLFQKAQIRSFLDFSKISMVFVLTGFK